MRADRPQIIVETWKRLHLKHATRPPYALERMSSVLWQKKWGIKTDPHGKPNWRINRPLGLLLQPTTRLGTMVTSSFLRTALNCTIMEDPRLRARKVRKVEAVASCPCCTDQKRKSAEKAMTMTMTLKKVQHPSMNAWPYRPECRGHDPNKKESVALMKLALLARCAQTDC